MNVIEFTLVQYTPMIHFLADQTGATIRGTELKPKLDRFLVHYAFDKKPEAYKPYQVPRNATADSEDHVVALDYRVTIEASGSKTVDIVWPRKGKTWTGVGGYFFIPLPEEGGEAPKKGVFADTVTVLFRSKHDDLIPYVEKFFPAFLATTNFGFRQHMGFGSFGLASWDDERKIDKVLQTLNDADAKHNALDMGISGEYQWRLSKEKQPDCYIRDFFIIQNALGEKADRRCAWGYAALSTIEDINKLMKSGVDVGAWRIPSYLLKKYAPDEMKIQASEKDGLMGLLHRIQSEPEGTPQFVRALLGLADHYEFKQTREKPGGYFEVADINMTNKVSRYPHPVTYKPFRFEESVLVRMYSRPTTHLVGGKSFEFKKRNSDVVRDTYQVPNDFSLESFISCFCNDYVDHITNEGRKVPDKMQRYFLSICPEEVKHTP